MIINLTKQEVMALICDKYEILYEYVYDDNGAPVDIVLKGHHSIQWEPSTAVEQSKSIIIA